LDKKCETKAESSEAIFLSSRIIGGIKKKISLAYKPDSVEPYHLSWHCITTMLFSAYPLQHSALKKPRNSSEQLVVLCNLFGISTRKVYPCHELPHRTVRSYRTFSPLFLP
jgi:hypothetical protein